MTDVIEINNFQFADGNNFQFADGNNFVFQDTIIDEPEAISQLIEYYSNLLIVQYHNKPKAKATIELLVRELLANGLLFDIRDAFSVEMAVGVQLDIIGKYVGLDRFYQEDALDGYFAFTTYDEVVIPSEKRGFAIYADTTDDGDFLTYFDVLKRGVGLDDESFRTLIKLRIIQNNSNHSHKSIDDSMYAFFGETVRPSSLGHMDMIYFIPYALSVLIKVAIQKQVLPRPMGVGLNIIQQNNTFFGFSTYNLTPTLITGFSNYADYDTKEGQLLDYDNFMDI